MDDKEAENYALGALREAEGLRPRDIEQNQSQERRAAQAGVWEVIDAYRQALRRLVEQGLVEESIQRGQRRWRLTAKGRELEPDLPWER